MTNFSVIVDTREQSTSIQEELSARGIPFIKRKLCFADYSFEIDGNSYEKCCCVERKNGIDEIVGNFTKGRERFEREFKRSKGCKVYLMIEASEKDIKSHNYRSTMSSAKVKSFIQTWCYKFGLKLKFIDKKDSTDFILETFENYIKSKGISFTKL